MVLLWLLILGCSYSDTRLKSGEERFGVRDPEPLTWYIKKSRWRGTPLHEIWRGGGVKAWRMRRGFGRGGGSGWHGDVGTSQRRISPRARE